MQIMIFAKCAKERSFSKAAKDLNLTPSAVSKSVRKLEECLGIRLFMRNTKKIALTQSGSYLLLFFKRYLKNLNKTLKAEMLICDKIR